MTRGYGRMWRGARRGQVMPFFALIITILMGGLVLGVDLSRLRAEAENAQRAANAAALAGVVYLPDFADSAYTRAYEEARKNGFVTGQRGVAVTPSRVPGYTGRLKITINEPVSLAFGGVFGLVPQTVSRSATAEFDQPVQMGSPDHVLGYAPFPTKMVTPSTYQGFYLGQRGRYDLEELGDAYSPYFESFAATNNYGVANNNPNPCTPTPLDCPGFKTNPDRLALNPTHPADFQGYDYVVDDPFTNTLVIKLFDPYDEIHYNDKSGKNHPGMTTLNSLFGSKLIDEYGSDNAGHWNNATTLEFSLSGPYQTPYDTSDKPITTTPSTLGSGQSCDGMTGTAVNCVVSSPSFKAGEDPVYNYCMASSPPHASCGDTYTPYAFRFMNYAIIHGRGIFHIHVKSTQTINPDLTVAEGTHLNLFGIAACADANPGLGTAENPSGSSDSYNPYKFNPAVDDVHHPGAPTNAYPWTSDPAASTAPGSDFWNQDSCPSPNDQPEANGQCPDPGKAAPGQCVHVYALGRMGIKIKLNGGRSLIPLGYVPAEYDGKTLKARLYDLGDTASAPSSGSVNTIQVLTPAGDQNYYGDMTHNSFPTNLDYTYEAAPTDNPGSGYITLPSSPSTPGSPAITVSCVTSCSTTSSLGRFNGSWLTVNTPIKLAGTSYSKMVNQFGGYWKILYSVASGSQSADTTTWEVGINGSPVHLVSGS